MFNNLKALVVGLRHNGNTDSAVADLAAAELQIARMQLQLNQLQRDLQFVLRHSKAFIAPSEELPCVIDETSGDKSLPDVIVPKVKRRKSP